MKIASYVGRTRLAWDRKTLIPSPRKQVFRFLYPGCNRGFFNPFVGEDTPKRSFDSRLVGGNRTETPIP